MRPARRSATVLRHVAFEDLGLLAPILDEAGWTVSFCEASIEDLSDRSIEASDLLIVLGGPIGACDIEDYPFLSKEIALLERRLAKDRPTLGIGLGSQLMAKALGAPVYPGPVKEIGWGAVELTDAGRRSSLAPLEEQDAMVLHWHGDGFDLPSGAVRLASTEAYRNQAFSYGRCSLGLQFHLGADPRQMEEWYVGHSLELRSAGIRVSEFRARTNAAAGRLRAQARNVFGRWLDEIETRGCGAIW